MEPVVLFPTCVIDAISPEAGLSAAAVLERMGMSVTVPDATTCCGQPAWNAGHSGEAAVVARTTLSALADTDGDIVVPAGSCATMIRVFWRELFELHGTPAQVDAVSRVAGRTFEFSEFVRRRGLPPVTRAQPTPVVHHHSCHMLRELGIRSDPEDLLDTVATDRREAGDERCCGFGGLFSVKLPEVSVAMADEVLAAYEASGARQVAGCDMSCLLHLQARASRLGVQLEFRHLAEMLDSATEARQ